MSTVRFTKATNESLENLMIRYKGEYATKNKLIAMAIENHENMIDEIEKLKIENSELKNSLKKMINFFDEKQNLENSFRELARLEKKRFQKNKSQQPKKTKRSRF